MTQHKTGPTFAEDVRAAAVLLESIAKDHRVLDQLSEDDRRRLQLAVAAVFNPDPVTRRKNVKADKKAKKVKGAARVDALLHETGIRTLRRQPVFTTPNVFPPPGFTPNDIPPDRDAMALLGSAGMADGSEPAPRIDSAEAPEFRAAPEEKHCYVCKQMYSQIHHFYDQLCPSCATLNFAKRTEVADLRGRVALLTGGRVKIGFQAGLKLLRCGAHLVVTTRFPRNSAERYAAEPDFQEWSHRLEIHGLDLRHTPSVEAFCVEMLARHSRLDFIVNNACQTVRRPPEFYKHMMDGERAALAHMPEAVGQLLAHRNGHVPGLTHAAELSQIALLPEDITPQHLFPEGNLDQDLQQVDLRGRNSWRLLMAEVSTVELLEVQLVNAIAPFIINARLKPLMLRTANRDKHIVNVSAVEGQFYRTFKTTRHPHTNMAKAALNMMTRTAATDYYNDGIHMNAVDTGWVTDEDPAEIAARKTAEHRFHPPLDIVDGAARIVDPIISGLNTGEHIWGKFLKDYMATDW